MRILSGLSTSLRSSMAVLVCAATLSVSVGCVSKQTTLQVVTSVNAHIPEVVAAADTVAATISALLPAQAALIAVGDTAFDVLAKQLQALTSAYIAAPNATTLQQIQTAINTLESNVNTATLNALQITDPVTQRLAIAALKGLLTVLTVVFGLIMPTESAAMREQLRATDTVHLAKLRPYMDAPMLEREARVQGVSVDAAFGYATAAGF